MQSSSKIWEHYIEACDWYFNMDKCQQLSESVPVRLFHLQTRISFQLLLANDLPRFLLIMRTRSFYSPVRRG